MENEKIINDSFTIHGETIPMLCWIKARKIYSTEKFSYVNRDLVGIPCPENIWNGDYVTENNDPLTEEEKAQRAINNQAVADTIAEQGGGNVVIEEGYVNEIVIPESATKLSNITANFIGNVTITNNGTKGVTINNTSGEKVDAEIISTNSGPSTAVLNGDYGNITTTMPARISTGSVDNVTVVDGNTNTSITVNAPFNNGATVNYAGQKGMTVTNPATEEREPTNVTINAPESTVTVTGKYNDLTSNVGDNTLIVASNGHVNKLIVKKGNVIVNDTAIENRIGEVVNNTNYSVSLYEFEANTWETFSGSKGITHNGTTRITDNITTTNKGVIYGILASGNYALNLQGHSIENSYSNAMILTKGNMNLNIYGPGTMKNNSGYTIWGAGTGTINIYSGDFIGSTHVVYCEKGNINIYGGSFKINGDGDTTFLINHLDKNWTAGTAKITIYGGRFYGFNPADNNAEPGGHANFLAEGYQSVEVESGVWEVSKA